MEFRFLSLVAFSAIFVYASADCEKGEIQCTDTHCGLSGQNLVPLNSIEEYSFEAYHNLTLLDANKNYKSNSQVTIRAQILLGGFPLKGNTAFMVVRNVTFDYIDSETGQEVKHDYSSQPNELDNERRQAVTDEYYSRFHRHLSGIAFYHDTGLTEPNEINAKICLPGSDRNNDDGQFRAHLFTKFITAKLPTKPAITHIYDEKTGLETVWFSGFRHKNPASEPETTEIFIQANTPLRNAEKEHIYFVESNTTFNTVDDIEEMLKLLDPENCNYFVTRQESLSNNDNPTWAATSNLYSRQTFVQSNRFFDLAEDAEELPFEESSRSFVKFIATRNLDEEKYLKNDLRKKILESFEKRKEEKSNRLTYRENLFKLICQTSKGSKKYSLLLDQARDLLSDLSSSQLKLDYENLDNLTDNCNTAELKNTYLNLITERPTAEGIKYLVDLIRIAGLTDEKTKHLPEAISNLVPWERQFNPPLNAEITSTLESLLELVSVYGKNIDCFHDTNTWNMMPLFLSMEAIFPRIPRTGNNEIFENLMQIKESCDPTLEFLKKPNNVTSSLHSICYWTLEDYKTNLGAMPKDLVLANFIRGKQCLDRDGRLELISYLQNDEKDTALLGFIYNYLKTEKSKTSERITLSPDWIQLLHWLEANPSKVGDGAIYGHTMVKALPHLAFGAQVVKGLDSPLPRYAKFEVDVYGMKYEVEILRLSKHSSESGDTDAFAFEVYWYKNGSPILSHRYRKELSYDVFAIELKAMGLKFLELISDVSYDIASFLGFLKLSDKDSVYRVSTEREMDWGISPLARLPLRHQTFTRVSAFFANKLDFNLFPLEKLLFNNFGENETLFSLVLNPVIRVEEREQVGYFFEGGSMLGGYGLYSEHEVGLNVNLTLSYNEKCGGYCIQLNWDDEEIPDLLRFKILGNRVQQLQTLRDSTDPSNDRIFTKDLGNFGSDSNATVDSALYESRLLAGFVRVQKERWDDDENELSFAVKLKPLSVCVLALPKPSEHGFLLKISYAEKPDLTFFREAFFELGREDDWSAAFVKLRVNYTSNENVVANVRYSWTHQDKSFKLDARKSYTLIRRNHVIPYGHEIVLFEVFSRRFRDGVQPSQDNKVLKYFTAGIKLYAPIHFFEGSNLLVLESEENATETKFGVVSDVMPGLLQFNGTARQVSEISYDIKTTLSTTAFGQPSKMNTNLYGELCKTEEWEDCIELKLDTNYNGTTSYGQLHHFRVKLDLKPEYEKSTGLQYKLDYDGFSNLHPGVGKKKTWTLPSSANATGPTLFLSWRGKPYFFKLDIEDPDFTLDSSISWTDFLWKYSSVPADRQNAISVSWGEKDDKLRLFGNISRSLISNPSTEKTITFDVSGRSRTALLPILGIISSDPNPYIDGFDDIELDVDVKQKSSEGTTTYFVLKSDPLTKTNEGTNKTTLSFNYKLANGQGAEISFTEKVEREITNLTKRFTYEPNLLFVTPSSGSGLGETIDYYFANHAFLSTLGKVSETIWKTGSGRQSGDFQEGQSRIFEFQRVDMATNLEDAVSLALDKWKRGQGVYRGSAVIPQWSDLDFSDFYKMTVLQKKLNWKLGNESFGGEYSSTLHYDLESGMVDYYVEHNQGAGKLVRKQRITSSLRLTDGRPKSEAGGEFRGPLNVPSGVMGTLSHVGGLTFNNETIMAVEGCHVLHRDFKDFGNFEIMLNNSVTLKLEYEEKTLDWHDIVKIRPSENAGTSIYPEFQISSSELFNIHFYPHARKGDKVDTTNATLAVQILYAPWKTNAYYRLEVIPAVENPVDALTLKRFNIEVDSTLFPPLSILYKYSGVESGFSFEGSSRTVRTQELSYKLPSGRFGLFESEIKGEQTSPKEEITGSAFSHTLRFKGGKDQVIEKRMDYMSAAVILLDGATGHELLSHYDMKGEVSKADFNPILCLKMKQTIAQDWTIVQNGGAKKYKSGDKVFKVFAELEKMRGTEMDTIILELAARNGLKFKDSLIVNDPPCESPKAQWLTDYVDDSIPLTVDIAKRFRRVQLYCRDGTCSRDKNVSATGKEMCEKDGVKAHLFGEVNLFGDFVAQSDIFWDSGRKCFSDNGQELPVCTQTSLLAISKHTFEPTELTLESSGGKSQYMNMRYLNAPLEYIDRYDMVLVPVVFLLG